MIKAIIFDMGGVVCRGKLELVLEKIADELAINKEELSNLFSNYKDNLITGRMKVSQFCNIIKNRYGIKKDIIPVWKQTYSEILSLNAELVGYMEELRKSYKIALITNTNELHVEINRERGVFKYFDEIVTSCELGIAKPNKEIFEAMLAKLKLKPNECIFIDDRLGNIGTPKQMGFKVIHFQDNQQLIGGLREANINLKMP
jgi:epoxide hydrolase-like predicted phosphatase